MVKMFDDPDDRAYPGLPWEPKAAFFALADCYRATSADVTALAP